MPDDPMTESQGDKIIDLLEAILKELQEINNTTQFSLQSGMEEANSTLVSINGEIANLKR
jgi:hypothetical protein